MVLTDDESSGLYSAILKSFIVPSPLIVCFIMNTIMVGRNSVEVSEAVSRKNITNSKFYRIYLYFNLFS